MSPFIKEIVCIEVAVEVVVIIAAPAIVAVQRL
jgi:hypothetical protein